LRENILTGNSFFGSSSITRKNEVARVKSGVNDELLTLIEGCKKKKYRYQKRLYNKYSGILFAICMRYLKDKEWASDCLHDGFIKIYESIDSFEGTGSFEGWIKRIQVNICLMELRRKKKEFAFETIEDFPDAESIDHSDVYENIDSNKMFEVINELPDGYRTIFNLYVIDNFTHTEIAQKLNISVGTSKSQYSRARQLVKQKLEKHIK
jgi:RNA polymerase sigma-70 factor (ECF subfamily)